MKRLWNNSLVAKFFVSYLVVIALLFGGFYYSSSTILRNFYIEWLSGRMEQEATLLSRLLPFGIEGAEFDRQCRELSREVESRITVIALDGRVLWTRPTVSQHGNHAPPGSGRRYETGLGTRSASAARPAPTFIGHFAKPTLNRPHRSRRWPTATIDSAPFVSQSAVVGLPLAPAAGLHAWLFSRF
jgi:hypothetical protein